ncbi:MAG: hypothetical protein CK426_09125, partial [Legionella sp.]
SARTAEVVNDKDLAKAFTSVKPFIGAGQITAMLASCYGEEGDSFVEKFKAIDSLISEMPVTYQQDGKGKDSVAHLHYFVGGCDWYITEKDMEGGVTQAYGYAVLNGDLEMAEFGYINISELLELGVELDLYFEPCTINAIVNKAEMAEAV